MPSREQPMHSHSLDQWTHDHVFLGPKHDRNERRTWFVVALTAVMMVGEICGGIVGSDRGVWPMSWHMATPRMRRWASPVSPICSRASTRVNSRFAFGTGKSGDLAAFSSAIIWR